MSDECQLCGSKNHLQLSHIIPNFVLTWAKDTSASFLRSSEKPNVRIQDGEKRRLLCFECEQRFSVWEKAFSEVIFVPLHQNEANPKDLAYHDWALKFAVSVSWRNLAYHRENQTDLCAHLSLDQLDSAEKAFISWRQFLLGNQKNPHEYEQHVLTFDFIESHSVPFLSPYINRYFVRAVDMDLLCAEGVTLTYTKLGRLAIFGFIQMKDRSKWKGTKIHVNKGKLGNSTYYIPQYLLRYLSGRADQIAAAQDALSEKQNAKVTETILKNPEKAAKSEIFKAVARDVALFGQRAFGGKGRKG